MVARSQPAAPAVIYLGGTKFSNMGYQKMVRVSGRRRRGGDAEGLQNEHRLKIGNIKCSFTTPKLLAKHEFYIDCFKVSIFKSCINVAQNRTKINGTGIRRYAEIDVLKSIIEDKYRCQVTSVNIDAIMLSRRMKSQYRIPELLRRCARFNLTHRVEYCAELFSGIYLIAREKRHHPSYNLFVSGSATVMGAKCLADIYEAQNTLDYIYLTHEE